MTNPLEKTDLTSEQNKLARVALATAIICVSFVLLSLLFRLGFAGGFTVFVFPLAAIAGHIAVFQIKRRGQQGRGEAVGAIIIGWLGFIIIGFLLYELIAVVLPQL